MTTEPPKIEHDAPGAVSAENLGATLLVVHKVQRRWGGRDVLQDASISLEPGTTAWLGGPNGAGKTTLLRIIAGLLGPHGGSVTLCGLDPERDRRQYQRHLGYLSAGDRGLYARLTVVQNLEFWCGIALVPRSRRTYLINAAVENFELQELATRRVDRMSMGQRQRARLSMAFLHEPDVVLLDEPHTSLDDNALELLEAAVRRHSARGGGTLWCSPATHHLPLHADVKYLLEEGRVRPL